MSDRIFPTALMALAATIWSLDRTSLAQDDSRPRSDDAALVADPAFDRFADLQLLGEAIDQGDAAAVADVGLQLAEGERVLGRPHRTIDAATVLSAAASLAARSGDAETLDRLAKAAARDGRKELSQQVAAAGRLAAASRAPHEPPTAVPADELAPAELARYKALSQEIDIAAALGDATTLDRARGEVEGRVWSSEQLSASLLRQLDAAREQMPAGGNPGAKILSRLRDASRGDLSFSTWDSQYVAANGQWIRARVTLNGPQGDYRTSDGATGWLYNVEYRDSSLLGVAGGGGWGGPPQTLTTITGDWQFQNGQTGTFSWNVRDGAFQGVWGYGQGGPAKPWRGQLVGGGPFGGPVGDGGWGGGPYGGP